MDRDRRHLQIVSGRGRAGQILFMFSVRRHPGYDFVALGDLIFDLVITGRRFPENLKGLLVRSPIRGTAAGCGLNSPQPPTRRSRRDCPYQSLHRIGARAVCFLHLMT